MSHWVSDCQLFEAASRASSTKFLDYSALEDEGIRFSETSVGVTLNTVCTSVKCSIWSDVSPSMSCAVAVAVAVHLYSFYFHNKHLPV